MCVIWTVIVNFSLTSRGKAAFSRTFGGGLAAVIFRPGWRLAAIFPAAKPNYFSGRRPAANSAARGLYMCMYGYNARSHYSGHVAYHRSLWELHSVSITTLSVPNFSSNLFNANPFQCQHISKSTYFNVNLFECQLSCQTYSIPPSLNTKQLHEIHFNVSPFLTLK